MLEEIQSWRPLQNYEHWGVLFRPCRPGSRLGVVLHGGAVQVETRVESNCSQPLQQLKHDTYRGDALREEQTGALAPSLDTGCTIRTADKLLSSVDFCLQFQLAPLHHGSLRQQLGSVAVRLALHLLR